MQKWTGLPTMDLRPMVVCDRPRLSEQDSQNLDSGARPRVVDLVGSNVGCGLAGTVGYAVAALVMQGEHSDFVIVATARDQD
jgi:hypothetical protein